MQQIERVGAVALLLLVVTMATVALWGDGESIAVAEKDHAVARVDSAGTGAPSARPRARGQRQRLPLNEVPTRILPTRQATAPAEESPRTPRFQGVAHSGGEALPAFAAAQQSSLTGRMASDSRKHKSAPRPSSSARTSEANTHPYTVRAGDCLGGIAHEQCGDAGLVKRIMALNGIPDANRIREGQVLRLPGTRPVAAPQRAPAPDGNRAASPRTYVVQAGDVLTVISQRTLGTSRRWREFLPLNEGLDPNRLQVGARLIVPAGAATEPVLLASARGGS
jgi:nucleoid-associated protein YgaU